ncbi:hypothetical protein N7539_005579 [Penicillium diatomitis]|uniref:N-acetyltransferase domain-containing protein n=1 Tax=Penicillium diatomitis TaxID=2819901 RepID=A0A9W9X7L2_9EURO|nr:uncharacterized protein N7539_005579 [Penicillium diatomitis]KAJ5485591.1 hypothetical protein N7539_005579 [Penicillium diatomitis]
MAHSAIPLTHGKHDMLDQVSQLNGRTFSDDPVIAYMLLDMSREERHAYLPTYWSVFVKSALLNDAVITEADGWKSAAVVLPPGKKVDNTWTLFSSGFGGVLWKMGFSGLKVRKGAMGESFKRLFSNFLGMTDNAKKIGLRGQQRYYYIFTIGTETEHRGKGLARAIIQDYMRKAQFENLPIWLEATTPNSRKLYLSLGFEDVEKIVLGKGKVDDQAQLQCEGSGVPLWAMIWWPSQSTAEASSSA